MPSCRVSRKADSPMSVPRDSWLEDLLNKAVPPEAVAKPVVAPNHNFEEDPQRGTPYRAGDVIGQDYEVRGVLGQGGFGIVYLVSTQGRTVALKTFRDEFLANQQVRNRFRKEASIWVELGCHPCIVQAYAVVELSGRLYVAVEYITPSDTGLNSLDGYLRQEPPDLTQSLRWAVQICHGMEYAYAKGIQAHRDLKPANIMITRDGTAKVTDFGIASVDREVASVGTIGSFGEFGSRGETVIGTGLGTPAYMSPEQFDNAAGCDERSDIYSFGVLLYEMLTGGRLPFVPSHTDKPHQMMADLYRLHHEASVPIINSPRFPIIRQCLRKSPAERYQSFREVRQSLEELLRQSIGEVAAHPLASELGEAGWINRGSSLANLGRYEEAVRCFDRALCLSPSSVMALDNKGTGLEMLGRHEEAIACFDEALRLDPCNPSAWSHKGATLDSLGRYEQALQSQNRALELNPHETQAWVNKAVTLENLGRKDEAIACCDKVLELDPRDTTALTNKANTLLDLGQPEEAAKCYDEALRVDPVAAEAWTGKGTALGRLGRHEEAILCHDKALQLDPRSVASWNGKGESLRRLGRYDESLASIERALELDRVR